MPSSNPELEISASYAPDGISHVIRGPELLSAEVDSEVVIMSLSEGSYFGLDDIASEIWRRIDQGSSLSALVANLVQDYDAPSETIATEVVELLRRMAEHNLVVLS